MEKEKLQPLSGFRDYRGSVKYALIEKLRAVFESFGYEGLETPSLEKQEILLSNYGEDAQKLLYLFEDNGSRPVGLRYDLTLPLARFVSGNLNELTLPYKRYEIGNAWRAERAQKGRLRQFTQADIDIIGCESGAAEEEIAQVLAAVSQKLNLPLRVLINDRQVVKKIFAKLQIDQEESRQLMRLMDKRDKLSDEQFRQELGELKFSDNQARHFRSIFLVPEQEAIEAVSELLKDDADLARLLDFIKTTQKIGLKAEYAPNMVRGLDYYTGTIFECLGENYPVTLIGGGRFDSLVESFTGQKIPSVGISFGVDRLTDVLASQEVDRGLFVLNLPETTTDVRDWVNKLRQSGKKVDLYLDSKTEMGKQIKYAAKKGYPKVVIPFEDEWALGKVIVKDLDSGQQEKVTKLTHEV